MSEPNKLKGELAILPDVTLNVELTAQHIIDMKVSQTEEMLIAEEEKLIDEMCGIEDQLEEHGLKREKALNKIKTAREKKARLTMRPIATSGSVLSVSSRCLTSEKGTVTVQINVGVGKKQSKKEKSCYVTGTLSFVEVIKAPASVKKIDATLESLEKQRDKIRNRLQKIKTNLANIPRMERRARAALAQKTLESTPAGKKFAKDLASRKLLT